MIKVWCVRADFGTFTQQFRQGGFVGIGWENTGDLSAISSREELYPIYKAGYPKDTSNISHRHTGRTDLSFLTRNRRRGRRRHSRRKY